MFTSNSSHSLRHPGGRWRAHEKPSRAPPGQPELRHDCSDSKVADGNPACKDGVPCGPAYTKTWFEDVPDNEDDSADSFGFAGKTRFDHELTSDIDVWYDYRFLWAEQDAGGYSHRMEAGITYDIIGDLDVRASYIWDYIGDPSEDENGDKPDKSDYELLLGVGYSF